MHLTQRLQTTLRWAQLNVPLYQEKWAVAGIKPEDVQSLEDLAKVPFTLKEDFKRAYPYGLFAVPLEQVVRIHSSTGTTTSRRWSGTPKGT